MTDNTGLSPTPFFFFFFLRGSRRSASVLLRYAIENGRENKTRFRFTEFRTSPMCERGVRRPDRLLPVDFFRLRIRYAPRG